MLKTSDPLCPLGFYPQVRWPTRCKRCYREYSEHKIKKSASAGLRKDNITGSSPSLTTARDDAAANKTEKKVNSSKSLLEEEAVKNYAAPAGHTPLSRRLGTWSSLRPSSWSAQDLRTVGTDDDDDASTVKGKDDDFMSVGSRDDDTSFNSALTAQSQAPPVPPRGPDVSASPSSTSSSASGRKRISVREVKPDASSNGDMSADVAFIIKLKDAKVKASEDDDDMSTIAPSEASVWTDATGGTDTTDTTLVDEKNQALEKKVTSLEKELDKFRRKVDRMNKEKKDLADKQSSAVKKSKSQSELLRLQQKVHELTTSNEDLLDEKKSMELEVLELNRAIDQRSIPSDTGKMLTDMQMRLSKAETLVEDLQEENEELKHQVKDMEEEMDEIHDSFREDQAEEYHDLKRELEQANKNCRIIQFKLRKAERTNDELSGQKASLEEQVKTLQASGNTSSSQRVEKLEKELKLANEVSMKLSEEVEQLRKKSSSTDSKAPLKRQLDHRQSSTSDESRLLRDLQDTLEREADLKEQLRFAEEEAGQLRKKLVRAEEENESLAIQLKKMAKKTRRQGSQEGVLGGDRDEGISEDIDELSWEELKIQLELNERETTSLRKKVDGVEGENEKLQQQLRELQQRVTQESRSTPAPEVKVTDPNAYYEQKMTLLEEEMNDLRKKLIDRERENDSLRTEVEMKGKKGGKVIYQRSSKQDKKTVSLDLNDTAHADLKRQLQLLETELQVLRKRNSQLETESETTAVENRRLSIRVGRSPPGAQEKIAMEKAELEERLRRAERRLTEREGTISELRQAIKGTSSGDGNKLGVSRSPREGRKADRNSEVDVDGLRREKDALQSELKSKERDLSVTKKKVTDLGSERDKLSETVRKMKDIPSLKTRIPKKVTDLTPKNTLKKWVEELEDEIAVQAIQMKNSSRSATSSSSSGKSPEIVALESKVTELTTATGDFKKMVTKLEREKEDLEIAKGEAEMAQRETQNEKKNIEKEKTKIEKEKRKLETDFITMKTSSEDIQSLKSQLQRLNRELDGEKTKLSEMKQQLELKERQLQRARKGEQAKDTTEKELAERVLKLTETEQRLKSSELKLKKTEKQVQELQEKAALADSRLSEAEERNQQLDSNQRHLSSTWLSERDELKVKVEKLKAQCAELEKGSAEKQRRIKELEESKAKAGSSLGASTAAKADVLQKEKTKLEKQVKELEDKITKNERVHRNTEEKLMKLEIEHRKAKEEVEKFKTSALAGESSSKQRVEKLEANMAAQMQEYEDLTRKYDLLEEDYVVIKAQMVMEKEQIEGEFTTLKHEYDTANRELQTLRDTYNSRQDQWIKEKLDMQEKVKEAEERLNRSGGDAWKLDRSRLQDQVNDKDTEVQRLKKAEEFYMEEINNIKRESDEMRRKLDDYNKVSKVQRSLSVDNSHLDKEIRELKARIVSEEKTHRQELSHLKIKHESGLSIMKDELHTLNQQVSKYKRERDTYKSMLEGAQRTIGDLKRKCRSGDGAAEGNASDAADVFEQNQRVRELTMQLNALEDQLSAARLEASKLRTEATTGRSAWEIRAHDLQTKINELEEDKIMSSGHSRISGIRARMELAWGKERSEHQRLIQETSKLAEELKNTLHEAERQLENERAEAKRKVEQVKRSMEDETTDTRKKAKELHDDLVELRDAHAKLRETLRRVLRDKERAEREREELAQRADHTVKGEAEEERKITRLVEQLQEQLNVLTKAQEVRDKQPPPSHPGPVKSYGQAARATALSATAAKGPRAAEAEKARADMAAAVHEITATIDELRLTHATLMEEKERGRSKNIRQQTYRRSVSMGDTLGDDDASSDAGGRGRRAGYPSPSPSMVLSAGRRGASLGRKSLSMGLRGDSQDSIYEREDGSIESLDPYAYTTLPRKKLERDISIDRVSTGSTQSEIITGVNPVKKKKGLKTLLKNLGKSKSIEESESGHAIAEAGVQGSGSDLSDVNASITEKEKKGLKGKFSKLFKTPPPSRSQRSPPLRRRSSANGLEVIEEY